MAPIRTPVKKSLVTAVVVGLVTLGTAGAAGAAGTTGGTAATKTHEVGCAGVRADLVRMHHRQAALSAKVSDLRASSARAANVGKGRRATAIHRNLVHWQKVQAHKINARFLRREAKLTALAAGRCQADAPSAATPTPNAGTTT